MPGAGSVATRSGAGAPGLGAAVAGGTVRRRRPGPTAAASRLLLLHGLAGSPAIWGPFMTRAEDGLELWDANLAWSADGSADWDHRADPAHLMAEVVAAVPGGPDIVVAHSYAANVMLELLGAGRGPKPSAAVLVSPFYRAAVGDFDWATMSYYMEGFQFLIDEGLRVGSAGRLRDELRAAMALRVRDRVGPYGWFRFFDSYLRTPFLDTAAVTLPVLVVVGEHDLAATPDDAKALAGVLPDCRLEVLDGTGHFPMAERPDAFAAVLHDFVSSLSSPTSTHEQRELP